MNGISVIGLGKLGLCSAACFADGGYRVFGVDIDKDRVKKINQGECPIEETGLSELLQKVKPRLKATTDYEEAIGNSEVTFIIVSTPSREDGSFSNSQVEEALRNIAPALKNKSDYHLVVITSTVMPGTTSKLAKPFLEEITGKKCGTDFGLAYNPEFIALGSVIKDFKNPDFILIGEFNSRDGEMLEEIYQKTCENIPRFARLTPLNAEIAKLCLNCYVTTKISFANSLGAICEKVPGADSDQITRSIGLDSRIGTKYFKTGLGFGGPCFPRDNRAFAAFACQFGSRAKLSELVDDLNRDQMGRIVELVQQRLKTGEKIAVLGVSYKPNTPIIEESQAIDIALSLEEKGYPVTIYDPQAMENTRLQEGERFIYAESLEVCLKDASLCLITTPWDEFKKIDSKLIRRAMKKAIIIDCWRLLEDKKMEGVEYISLGKG